MKRLFAIIVLALPTLAVQAQKERLKSGKMYEAGEILFAPHFGFTATVPQGWTGILPRESEVFLLSSQTRPIEIFVFANEKGDLKTIKSNWEKGVPMDEHIKLKPKNASIQDGLLTSEVLATGPTIDKSKRAYAVAKCSELGPCVISLAFMAAADFDNAKKTVDEFMTQSKFEAPSLASPYEKFDWKKFLAGKVLIAYDMREKGSKENKVDLCSDGTFSADISKKGVMKNQNPQYRGRMSGIWTAEGIGETGTLVLEFKKKDLAPMQIMMTIHDEQIYANQERYFAGVSEKCK
jgi:hypothetical protein